MVQYLQVGKYRISCTLRRMKSIRLRIDRSSGEIKLSAPFGSSQALLQQFLDSKLPWIEKNMLKLQSNLYLQDDIPRDGDCLWLEGKQYTLRLVPNSLLNRISMEHGTIFLHCESGCTPQQCQILLHNWYRIRLEQRALSLIGKWKQIMGVEPGKLSIKQMKSRWGSCNIRNHRITLNLQLSKWGDDVLEYIVVHELAHLLEASHNEVFKQHLSHYLPDWKARKALLLQGLTANI